MPVTTRLFSKTLYFPVLFCGSIKDLSKTDYLPLLTSKHISLKVRDKVFSACDRPAMLYCNETWAANACDLQRLLRNDRTMIRWICGIKPEDEISSASLLLKLGIEDVAMVLQTRHLRWYGHVQRAKSSVNSITNLVIPGPRNRGGPRKIWSQCIRKDLTNRNLKDVDPLNRVAWRAERDLDVARCCPPLIPGKRHHHKD